MTVYCQSMLVDIGSYSDPPTPVCPTCMQDVPSLRNNHDNVMQALRRRGAMQKRQVSRCKSTSDAYKEHKHLIIEEETSMALDAAWRIMHTDTHARHLGNEQQIKAGGNTSWGQLTSP